MTPVNNENKELILCQDIAQQVSLIPDDFSNFRDRGNFCLNFSL